MKRRKRKYKDYHHYKGDQLSRSEKVERKVVELILVSEIPDSQRENSKVWELKHSAGCCQIAKILAQKRDLDVGIAEVIAVLHDIYAILAGKYKDHARLGAPLAEKILKDLGGFLPEEIKTITEAIKHHSEKEIYTNRPYVELIKDADVFDCSLYKGAEGFYRIHKKEPVFREYVSRMKKVRQELGLPLTDIFRE